MMQRDSTLIHSDTVSANYIAKQHDLAHIKLTFSALTKVDS